MISLMADPLRDFDNRLDQAAHVTTRLSHDFGNVLTGIMGFAELALAQVPEGSLASVYLREVLEVARGGADGLKQLHLFCRQSTPSFQPTRPDDVITQALGLVRAKWGDRIQFEIRHAADLPAVACDANSLEAALTRLLANACEAINERGTVTLDARLIQLDDADSTDWIGNVSAGPYVEITVADTGAGMSAETLQRVFADPFFSTKPRQRGLGLPIVYGIARRFGGGLRWGANPEGGTITRLVLPATP